MKNIVTNKKEKLLSNNSKSSEELKQALIESDKIIKEIKKGKRKSYDNIDDLIKSLND